MNAIIYKYKKTVSITLTLCIQLLILFFIFNYNIKTWMFSEHDIQDGSSKDNTHVYFDDNLPIKLKEQDSSEESAEEDTTSRQANNLELESPIKSSKEKLTEESSPQAAYSNEADTQEISDNTEEFTNIAETPKDINVDTEESIEEQSALENAEVNQSPVSAIPVKEVIPEPIAKPVGIPIRKKVRRVVRKVVRRKNRIYNPLSRTNILNTAREIQREKVNVNGKLGNETKYKHVTERLERMRYYSYKCNVHKTLKAEFIKHRQPIAFDEDFEYQIEANLIISSDGSVKFEYKNPTGNQEFDDYITFVLNQTKLPPMPAWAKGQTLTYPFNPKLMAKKGTHYYRYYGPGPESF